ncbi:MAG: sigma-70 family RNA polymerase sigma factor [Moraxellaceae bacterium]|nr:sigma-70 family RNA polymerase sigma factor [Moraxellaceae bacterium]
MQSSLGQEVGNLYSQHHSWLHDWLRRRLGCSHNAADLAHDTYLRVILSGRTPSADEARPHLMQIAKGLVIDRHRRSLIEKAYLEALAHLPEAVAPSPEARAMAVQALLRIDAMLNEMSSKVREVFLLSQIDGLTYSAIAERQRISVATVRKYMLKAMVACYTALDDDAGAPSPEGGVS